MSEQSVLKDIEGLIFNQPHDHLEIRGEQKKRVLDFLNKPVLNTARALYHFIQEIHKKDDVFNFMDDLRLYENTLVKILPEQREHYIHSASVYVLGLAIYNSCQPLRQAVEIERHPPGIRSQKTSFLFRWSLAACLHDIAYPLELTLKSFNKYSTQLHEISDSEFSFVEINRDLYDRFNLLPIIRPEMRLNLDRKDTALGLIAARLTHDRERSAGITYETLLGILSRYLDLNLKKGKIDHGAFSSIILLNRIHELYENKNWPVEDFYYEVVDSATAIFLHNAYRFSQLKDILGKGIFRYDSPSPLGYLLYLCDILCEWLRGRKRDIHHYGIEVTDTYINFSAPKKIKKRMVEPLKLLDDRIPVRVHYGS